MLEYVTFGISCLGSVFALVAVYRINEIAPMAFDAKRHSRVAAEISERLEFEVGAARRDIDDTHAEMGALIGDVRTALNRLPKSRSKRAKGGE